MHNDHSLFTVVIPTLNVRPEFLAECLESIAKQSLLPTEIIIVNNGESGVEVAEGAVTTRIIDTVFRAGVAQARNIGATVATTPYVAFLDDDDLWAPDYLELMARHIEAQNPDCLVARLDQLVGENVLPFKNAHGSLSKSEILVRNPGVTGSSVVARRTTFLMVGGYHPGLPTGQDKAIILEMIRAHAFIITAQDCQAIFRHHAGERQSDDARLARGIFAFYQMYKREMSLRQKAKNLAKVARYALKATMGR